MKFVLNLVLWLTIPKSGPPQEARPPRPGPWLDLDEMNVPQLLKAPEQRSPISAMNHQIF